MPQVMVKVGEPIDVATRRFKRIVEKEGLLRRLRQLAHYVKPSKKRQLRKAAAVKRSRKKIAREKAIWEKLREEQDRR